MSLLPVLVSAGCVGLVAAVCTVTIAVTEEVVRHTAIVTLIVTYQESG